MKIMLDSQAHLNENHVVMRVVANIEHGPYFHKAEFLLS